MFRRSPDSASLDPDGCVALPDGATLDDLLRVLKDSIQKRRGQAVHGQLPQIAA